MEITLNDFNFKNPLRAFINSSGFWHHTDDSEQQLVMTPDLGHGGIRIFQLREDIHLTVQSFELNTPLTIDAPVSDDHLELNFCQSGDILCRSYEEKIDLGTRPNQRAFFHCRNLRAVFEILPRQKILSVTIRFSPEVLSVYLQALGREETDTTVETDPDAGAAVVQRGITTPEMALILRQILNVPFIGSTKRIYLEAKALELIALHLAQHAVETPRDYRKQ